MANTHIAAAFLAVSLLLLALCVYDLAGGDVTVAGVGNLLTGVATVVGATAAILALSTWRKERDAALAKKLAAALYQYRLSLHRIRSPFHIPEDGLNSAEDENGHFDLNTARLVRWRHSRIRLQEVEALLSEADLHWPRKATDAFADVSEIEKELADAVLRFGILARRQTDDDERLGAQKLNSATWGQRFDTRSPEVLGLKARLEDTFSQSDEMRNKIDAAFGRIETFLRSRI